MILHNDTSNMIGWNYLHLGLIFDNVEIIAIVV